jgi:predicted dehydrogenase
LIQTSWVIPDKTPFLDDFMQVITTSGVANIDVLHSGLSIWREDGVEIPDVGYEPRLRGSVYGALREELSYFALCALENRQPTIVTAEDGVEAVRVALAFEESARSDREIDL